MGESPVTQAPAGAGHDRLDSWKEIAAYLKRDVTTVQRWEKRGGLPVHRHMHEQRGAVYASRVELDAWWNNGRNHVGSNGQEASPARFPWRLHLTLAAALVLAGALGVITWRFVRPPRLSFQQRDWVLITNFENRTGEPVLDGTIEAALERELGNSGFVNVAPRERIDDALRLMKKPAGSRLDRASGREVCLRDGGIRFLVTGRIQRLAQNYLLDASLVEPASGVMVATISEQAASREAILPAVRTLSNRLRNTLGEKLASIQQGNQNLEKATTPSLRALQLYSQGREFVALHKWPDGAQLFEQALAEDPDFASAHVYLAWCYHNVGKRAEAAPHFERAFRLADTASDRERYFILGSYYHAVLHDYEKAVQAYEVLVRLYPDDLWGVNNLRVLLHQVGRGRDAIPYVVALGDLRPNDPDLTYLAWNIVHAFQGDTAAAKRIADRALRLASAPATKQTNPFMWTEVQFWKANQYLERRELPQALNEVEHVAGILSISGFPIDREQPVQLIPADIYWNLGKLHAAENYYQMFPPALLPHHLQMLAEYRGNQKALREHLRAELATKGVTLGTPVYLARAGMFTEWRLVMSKAVDRGWSPLEIQWPRGELALAQGRTAEAVRLLRDALDLCREGFCEPEEVSHSLARALERQGDLQAAIDVLRKSLVPYPGDHLAFMARNEYQLLQLYKKLHREEEAGATEADLRHILSVADADHPILLQLKHQPSAAASGARN